MRSAQPIKPLLSCLVVLLLGYSTGLQLGRIAPYAVRLGDEFGFSHPTIGWLTSLVTLFVALFAIPAARVITSFGLVLAIKLGAIAMAVGAVLFAFADTLPLMIAARVIEAAGHIITVIAAPSYLAVKAPDSLRRVFLALWSSFVPVGFALSNGLSGVMPQGAQLQDIWFAYAGAMGVVAFLVLIILADAQPKTARGSDPVGKAKIAWALVVSFGVYAFLSIGFFTFSPSYTATSGPQMVSAAVVPLFVPLGSFTAAFLFARTDGALPPRLISPGFLLIGCCAAFCFPETASDGSVLRAVFAFACGLTAAAIFTSVPVVTDSADAAARTIGAIAQAGGAMVLLGAPLSGFILETGGWGMLEFSFLGAALAAASIALVSLRRANI
ncbi:MFS transporter [Shimia sp.]|uniref:MFS transporter n=1 Tax=Shimia sp. TaxID=1954381 RepID=UPI003297E16D